MTDEQRDGIGMPVYAPISNYQVVACVDVDKGSAWFCFEGARGGLDRVQISWELAEAWVKEFGGDAGCH